MSDTITLQLTEDEIEILVDALEADKEGYEEAAKEARGNNSREDVETFTEAGNRIELLMLKLSGLIDRD